MGGDREISVGEFKSEALFVIGFEKTRPQLAVHGDGRADDGFRQLAMTSSLCGQTFGDDDAQRAGLAGDLLFLQMAAELESHGGE